MSKRVEQYPGGPSLMLLEPHEEPDPAAVVCCICGAFPACDGLVIEWPNRACRACWYQYPYNTNLDIAPPGMEMNGTGI